MSKWRLDVGECWRVKDENDATVCTLSWINNYRRRDVSEVRRNANLISAAPDLLEALEEMVEAFDPFAQPGGWCDSEDAFVNELLVKKAEGIIAEAKG